VEPNYNIKTVVTLALIVLGIGVNKGEG